MIGSTTQPAAPHTTSPWPCVCVRFCVGGLICNVECTEWEDEEERWHHEAVAKWRRDGFRKEMESEKNSGWREKWNTCYSTRESHQSTVFRHMCTLTHAHIYKTHNVAICPRRSRGEHHSSHYNYFPLFFPPSLTNTSTPTHKTFCFFPQIIFLRWWLQMSICWKSAVKVIRDISVW